MGSSEIWDKYHECCIGNLPFPIQQEWYLSQISLLPMLFPVNTVLAAYALHMRMPCISVAMYAICHYVLNMCQH